MKIDTDLRLAIKAAEKAQPRNDYAINQAAKVKAIEDFMKRKPAAGAEIRKLVAAEKRHHELMNKAGGDLCKKFGLRTSNGKLEFAYCGEGSKRFVKAGGKLPKDYEPWTTDAVMAELAVADPKQGAAILRRLGINWS